MTRPYEPLHMTTARWLEIQPIPVRLDQQFRWGQDQLTIEGMLNAARGGTSFCGDPLPHLVRYQGQLWVSDGHHRIVAAIVRGEKIIMARVLVKEVS